MAGGEAPSGTDGGIQKGQGKGKGADKVQPPDTFPLPQGFEVMGNFASPFAGEVHFDSKNGTIQIPFPCFTTNKKMPPRTVLLTLADQFKVGPGAADFAPKWVFAEPKKIDVINSVTKAPVTLAEFLSSSGATALNNHTPLSPWTGVGKAIPKTFKAGEQEMGYKVAGEPWSSFFQAVAKTQELDWIWVVKKNKAHEVVPTGVALIAPKQLIFKAGGLTYVPA